jgi:hypothetical protein
MQWMGSRRKRRSRRQPNQGNPSPENSSQATGIDALLDQAQKIDLAGIEDERARAIVGLLLNLLEDLRGQLRKAHQEPESQATSPGVHPPRRRILRRKSGRSPNNEPSGRS